MVNKKKRIQRKVNIKFFKKQNNTIRTLSQISYRLINILDKNQINKNFYIIKEIEEWKKLYWKIVNKKIKRLKNIHLIIVSKKKIYCNSKIFYGITPILL